MAGEHPFGRSKRNKRLADKFRDKRFRDSYVSANVRRFLAQQLRSLRGHMSQEEFGQLLGIPQSVVSRYEDPSYGKFSLQTLLQIAAKLNRAFVARIVDFPTFVRFTEDLSENARCPQGYEQDAMDRLAIGLPLVRARASSDGDPVVIPPQSPSAGWTVMRRGSVGGEWLKQPASA